MTMVFRKGDFNPSAERLAKVRRQNKAAVLAFFRRFPFAKQTDAAEHVGLSRNTVGIYVRELYVDHRAKYLIELAHLVKDRTPGRKSNKSRILAFYKKYPFAKQVEASRYLGISAHNISLYAVELKLDHYEIYKREMSGE